MDENIGKQDTSSEEGRATESSLRFRTLGGPLCITGSTLVLLCSFGLKALPGGRGGGFVDIMMLRALRTFVRDRAIFFANPLSPERLAAQAADLVRGNSPSKVDVVCCGIAEESIPRDFPALHAVHHCAGTDLPVDPAAYDVVLLAYPDPLGLGWGRLERRLLRASRRAPLVLNGRGRVMPLTPRTRRLLRVRRLLALTRIPELIFAAFVIPAAAFLALKDKLAGRA